MISCSDGTCLCANENNFISLPFSRVTGNATFHSQSRQNTLEATGLDYAVSSIFRAYKIWIPNPSPIRYITHIIFLMNITPETKKSFKAATGKFSGKLKWVGENEMFRYYTQDAIISPVLLELYPKIVTDKTIFYPNENEITNVLTELAESCLIDRLSTNTEIVVDSSGLKSIQILIYKEFIAAAFPSVLLSYQGFSKFLIDLGVPKDDVPYIFRAADLNNRRFLSFHDFISVLAVLEPTTNHGGIAGEVRCRYIFRFFDKDRDGLISIEELKDMVIYMRKAKGEPVDAANVEKEHKAYCTSLNVGPNRPLSLPDFLKSAGELKIRGLSQILRIPKSVKALLQNIPKETKAPAMPVQIAPKQSVPSSQYTKQGNHELAVHSIRVQKSGTQINLDNIWMLKDVSSQTTLEYANITRESRRNSLQINAPDSLCNELIKSLRYLVYTNKVKSGNRGNRGAAYQWGNLNPSIYAQRLIQVCGNVSAILKQESRLLDLRSPIYIMGDFHGNFGDLQSFERMFWPLGPGFCPCELLFLGDYVDRGPFGVEIVTYLFCYKVLYPQKMRLIRGNHEIRDIQKAFTFYTECQSKFGDKIGFDVWENVNQTFDSLPVAAVVDGKLFCCHGGIPPPWLCPIATAINNIPVVLSEPDTQSTLAWEILWNDPIRQKQITTEMEAELKHNEGFAANARRGTAHVFNCDGLERFLNVNGFSHVIRAHEVALAGYSVLLKGKLVTLFSTSNYNGGTNQSACILVEKGKVRMMRLDPNT